MRAKCWTTRCGAHRGVHWAQRDGGFGVRLGEGFESRLCGVVEVGQGVGVKAGEFGKRRVSEDRRGDGADFLDDGGTHRGVERGDVEPVPVRACRGVAVMGEVVEEENGAGGRGEP